MKIKDKLNKTGKPALMRIGIDYSLNNIGSKYSHHTSGSGLEIEQCQTLMQSLGWEYEIYGGSIGLIFPNGTATGMWGDLQAGRLDMICGRYRMTPDRLAVFQFAYPVQVEVKQVYLINHPTSYHDAAFPLRPFSTFVWIGIIASIILITMIFILIRFVEVKEPFSRVVYHSVAHVISTITDLHITGQGHATSNYAVFRIATGIWLLVWFHVFVDSYSAELREILIVSDKNKPPFDDFHGLVKQLKSGSFRFLTSSIDRIPECPAKYTPLACQSLFTQIFTQYPPVIGPPELLNNKKFLAKQEKPLVGLAWYPGPRLTAQYSLWTQDIDKSDVWVIRDFSTVSAAYPIVTNFTYLRELNQGIIDMLPGFSKIDNHYTPAYPPVKLTQSPTRSAFTILQLASIFYMLIVISGIAAVVLVGEILLFRYYYTTSHEFLVSDDNWSLYGVYGKRESPPPSQRYFRKDLFDSWEL